MPDKICSRKIGIMGGTFNPIHKGHLYLAQVALEQAALDNVIFMPSGQSYMKAGMDVLKGDIRSDMVKLAIAGNPSFVFSDMEIKRAGNTYTYETLTILKETHPYDTFYFIVGADSLFSMENWKEPKEIFNKCIVLAAVRENMDKVSMQKKVSELQEKFGAVIQLLDFPKTDISSCFIREQIALDKDISHLVPETVRNYIKEHKLYQ